MQLCIAKKSTSEKAGRTKHTFKKQGDMSPCPPTDLCPCQAWPGLTKHSKSGSTE